MLNINQVTSSLASMPDQALQQFASMHKSDPYMLSLAMSESSRRKQLRTAMTPQPGEAPKVVDQAIAGMAPQEYFDDTADASASGQAVNGTGIAALPAGAMEFASGGIVSFEEGGETSSPYGRALSRWWESVGDTVSGWGQGISDYTNQLDQQSKMRAEIMKRYGAQASVLGGFAPGSDSARANAQSIMDSLGSMSPAQMQAVLASGSMPPATAAPKPAVSAPQKAAPEGSWGAPPQTTPSVAPAAAMATPPTSVSGGTRANVGVPGMRAAPAAAAPQGGLADMYRKLMGSRIDEIRGDMDKREADYAANRPPSEDYAEHKAMLGEDTFERDKEHAKGLALLAAAGAIAQGGQTTLQSLVAGATEGGKVYAGSMKELKAAQRERKKGLADLAVAQRAAARGDFDQAQARKEKGLDRIASAQDRLVDLVADDYKMGSDQRFQLRKLTIEMDNRMRIARLQASSGGGAGGGAALDLRKLALRKQVIATRLTSLKNPYDKTQIAERDALNRELDMINEQLGGSAAGAPAGPAIPVSAFGNLRVP